MTEKLKTIKELADELGVSKQAVWQKIKRETSMDLRQFMSKKGNTVYIDVDGQKAIKKLFLKNTSTKNVNTKRVLTSTLMIFRMETRLNFYGI